MLSLDDVLGRSLDRSSQSTQAPNFSVPPPQKIRYPALVAVVNTLIFPCSLVLQLRLSLSAQSMMAMRPHATCGQLFTIFRGPRMPSIKSSNHLVFLSPLWLNRRRVRSQSLRSISARLVPSDALVAKVDLLFFYLHWVGSSPALLGYVNVFVKWVNDGAKWQCNLCGMVNDTPTHYYCGVGGSGYRLDANARPELSRGSVDFVRICF